MQYPTVNSYIETLNNPRGLFSTLHPEAQIDENGKLFYYCGNYSVVFKVEIDGILYALKCFTRHNKRRFENYKYISEWFNESPLAPSLNHSFVKFQYLEREICATVDGINYDYFPVILMEWIEGQTLSNYLKRQCKQNNTVAITSIRNKIGDLFLDLLDSGIAHGDLKHDNIIVSDNNELMLVDYDGMYVSERQGCYSTEMGTREFQHPLRDHLTFDKHLDNYSMVLISAAMNMLLEEPSLMASHVDDDCFVLNPERIFKNQEPLLNLFIEQWFKRGDTHLALMAMQLHNPLPEITNIREILANVFRPKTINYNNLTTFSAGHRFGYQDQNNNIAIAPLFDSAYEFSDDLALVKFGKKNYYIDKSGAVKLDLAGYKYVEPFSCGRAKVSSDGLLWGYIDVNGLEIIECHYRAAHGFSENLAAVMCEKMWGYINIFGTFVIDSKYDSAESFHNGRAFVSQTGIEKQIIYPEHKE